MIRTHYIYVSKDTEDSWLFFEAKRGSVSKNVAGNAVIYSLNPIIPDDWTACCELLINCFKVFSLGAKSTSQFLEICKAAF